MRRWTLVAALAAALVALAAAGCGSSNKSTASSSSSGNSGGAYGAPSASTSSTAASSGAAAGSGSKVKLAADEEGKLYFNPRSLKAKAGTVTLAMNNPKTTGLHHGIAVAGMGVDKDGKIVAPGSTSTISLKLKPGRYTFYCPVPGHRQGGMQGTLTVQ